MKVFGNYARYYDLLYRDKNYAGEAQFVQKLLQIYAPSTKYILDLGCGTGTHAVLLAEQGYRVHGVDLSSDMLRQANERLSQLPNELATRLEFSHGDIRTIRLEKQFDAVISLFHVMSYQTNNKDLQSVFATVKAHLRPNGIFIFDCWYGPSVLSDRPTIRVKRLEDKAIAVTRIAEPALFPNENRVDIHYQVFVRNKTSGTVDELQETHKMRYLFKPEIDSLFAEFQLEPIEYREWMTNRDPGFDTWGVYFVARG